MDDVRCVDQSNIKDAVLAISQGTVPAIQANGHCCLTATVL